MTLSLHSGDIGRQRFRGRAERGWLSLTLLFCLLAGLTPWTKAQVNTGSITGLVTDPSGAVVPGAQVTLTDVGKGFSFKTTTDSAGRYLLLSLPPSMYKLGVEAPGFKLFVRDGVTLDVNQNPTIDVGLQLGATTQTVEVKGTAPILSAQDAVTGQVVDRKFLNDLPVITRSVFDLAYLTPGVTEASTPCNSCTPVATNFISNGSRNATADVLIDGVTTTNQWLDTGAQIPTYTPSVDAVQEFKVQQSNFSAEFGFSGASAITVVTRSGTNAFHGSAYEYVRNQIFDANNFFNNASGIALPPLRKNNYGFTVGGPVRKDKTFFFFDFDWIRIRSLGTSTAGVPSAAERQGDFGEACANAGATFDSAGMCSKPDGQLWDPYSGVYSSSAGGPVRSAIIPFNNLATYQSPGNPKLNGTGYQLPAVPGNLIDPAAYKLMQFFPLPNYNVGKAAYNPYDSWIHSGSNLTNNDQYDIKIDHRFSDKDLFAAKYSQQWGRVHYYNCYPNIADPCTEGPVNSTAHLVALTDTHTFAPNLLLNVSYGLTRGWIFYTGPQGDFPSQKIDPASVLGMPKYMDLSGIPYLPSIWLSNYAMPGPFYLGNIGSQPWAYMRDGQETHDLLGMLSWIKGPHELKFGAEGRMHRVNFSTAGTPAGMFAYDRTGTSQQPFSVGGDDLASFLIGVGGPGSSGQYEIPALLSNQSFQYGGFAQDKWKVKRNLTLNIGLRYEITLPRTERHNRMNSLDPNVVSPLQVPALGTLHGGEVFVTPSDRSNYATDWTNLQPRIGFAYRILPKTVLRGGYGIFYDAPRSASAAAVVGFQGYDEVTPWITTYQRDGATPWGRFSDPFPGVGPKLPPGNSLGLMNDVGLAASGPIKSVSNKVPSEQTWTFGMQREVPGNILIDANYIGKKGTHLYYGGGGALNSLGPQIEHYSSDQITALNSFVPNPFYGIITDPNSSLAAPAVPEYQLQLPFPQFTNFTGDYPPYANSIYNAFELRVEKRFSAGFQFLATYTVSKSIDDSSTIISWLGGFVHLQDPNNRELERSLSSWDIPQVLQISYLYELPVGRGKRLGGNMHPVLNAFVGGWQTNGIWRFNEGRPIAVSLEGGQGLPTYGTQMPNVVGKPERNYGSDWLTHYFANPEVFTVPAPFTVGDAPRTLPNVRAPGQANATLSVFKEFPLSRFREGMRLEYRLEAFNAFNHPQFDLPDSTVNSANFGVITNTANFPREVQMALKFYW
jgi:hypothetical protein